MARVALLASLLAGCASHADAPTQGAGGDDSGGAASDAFPTDLPYARSVESFEPGAGSGYNHDKLPDIVLGPPGGVVSSGGSLDVASLGAAGSIVVGFGDKVISDGPGVDFVIFENPFWPGGDPTQVYAELGEVSVSEDGETWHTFACDSAGDGQGRFAGCAGFSPTLAYDPLTLVPLDPTQTGGDAFDLAELSVPRARFVKLHDLETLGSTGTSSGFDLDAVGIVNVE